MGKSDTESILVICKGTIKASAGWHAGGQRDGVGSEQGGDEVDKKPQTQHTQLAMECAAKGSTALGCWENLKG